MGIILAFRSLQSEGPLKEAHIDYCLGLTAVGAEGVGIKLQFEAADSGILLNSHVACPRRLMQSLQSKGHCEHLPVSRVVMYSISLLGCFACMYKACRSATYRIKAP